MSEIANYPFKNYLLKLQDFKGKEKVSMGFFGKKAMKPIPKNQF
jgi:hypothetical protein